MCVLCQRDNPFDTIRDAGRRGAGFGGEAGRIKAEIRALKAHLAMIEEFGRADRGICGTIEDLACQLREYQYKLSRMM